MTTNVLEDQRTVSVIVAVSFLLFLIGNLPWHLDDYDQAKQAFTSFQMIKESRWFYQQTPHEHVATKPPLLGWISAGFFGLNLVTPRLAALVRTDMPLALVIFLIGLLIWKKIREGTEWRVRDQIYVFALLAIAMLIKGPIVYAFLLPGIALFEWRRRRHAVVAGVGDTPAGLIRRDYYRTPGPVGGHGLRR